MKLLKKHLILLSIIAILTNCGGDGGSDPTPTVDPVQATIDGLAKTWVISGVSLDGTNVASDWDGVSFSFTANKSFAVSGLSTSNSLIWPSAGTYSFPDKNKPLKVLRNDGVEITIGNLTESTATLSFTITGRTGGKQTGLAGAYSFDLSN